MKRGKRELSMCFMLVFIPVLIASCGGGDGNGGTPVVTYTGKTSQALITNSSAEAIAAAAFENGEAGGNITEMMDMVPMGGASLSLGGALPGPAGKAVNRALPGGMPRYTDSGTVPGDCGGQTDYSVTVNESTGDFTMSLTFKSFCEPEYAVQMIMDGSVVFTGKVNLDMRYLEHMTATFGYLTSRLSDNSENISGSGTITMTMTDSSSGTMTMDFVTRDNITGKTYRVNNYVVTITNFGSYEEISITSGRFYHHDYGYVDITTPIPLQIYSTDDHPSSGMLEFDGSAGTSARLTFLDATSYQVTADLDNDEAYDDYDSGPRNW